MHQSQDVLFRTRRRTADRVFGAACVFNVALTLLWVYTLVSGRATMFFRDYSVDLAALGRVATGIVFFYVVWGVIWWLVKASLLTRLVGFTPDERRQAFASRMQAPYDVGDLTARYSERRIRITDMIGRRGRFITLAASGFFYLYTEIRANPTDQFATAFLQDNLFDAVVTGWVFLALFYRNGIVAAFFYGPQSRVMDGVLARANCLLITTLWAAFKFIMVPMGAALSAHYPREQFAAIFALIWGNYLVTDALSEIVGSLFGRQRIRVFGVGDVNRKSVAGIVGGFAGAVVFSIWVIGVHGLGGAWYGLGLTMAVSSTLLELYSPRGTDDFTMATANALWCLVFAAWLA